MNMTMTIDSDWIVIAYGASILLGIGMVWAKPSKYSMVGKAIFPFVWVGMLGIYLIALIGMGASFIPLLIGEGLAALVFKEYKAKIQLGRGRK